MDYLLDPGAVATIVAGVTPDRHHAGLIRALARAPALSGVRWLTDRDGYEAGTRKVITPEGQLLHTDHRAWLAAQVEADGGDVPATYRRLKSQGLRLASCHMTRVFLYVDRGGPRAEQYLQVEIWQEHDRVDRPLVPLHPWSEPRELSNLVDPSMIEMLPENDRVGFGSPRYRLERIVDVARFLSAAERLFDDQQERAGQRLVTMRSATQGERTIPLKEAFPRAIEATWKGRRFVDDWALSSAGLSGARLCEHWALDVKDYTSPKGERSMSMIPVWGCHKKLAEIKRASNAYELYGKLQALDQRLGVPFGWFFYMTHGNRVHGWAGEIVLAAAEAGRIVMPEHDYRVLKRWCAAPYGF
jgi:hypothetical protein